MPLVCDTAILRVTVAQYLSWFSFRLHRRIPWYIPPIFLRAPLPRPGSVLCRRLLGCILCALSGVLSTRTCAKLLRPQLSFRWLPLRAIISGTSVACSFWPRRRNFQPLVLCLAYLQANWRCLLAWSWSTCASHRGRTCIRRRLTFAEYVLLLCVTPVMRMGWLAGVARTICGRILSYGGGVCGKVSKKPRMPKKTCACVRPRRVATAQAVAW